MQRPRRTRHLGASLGPGNSRSATSCSWRGTTAPCRRASVPHHSQPSPPRHQYPNFGRPGCPHPRPPPPPPGFRCRSGRCAHSPSREGKPIQTLVSKGGKRACVALSPRHDPHSPSGAGPLHFVPTSPAGPLVTPGLRTAEPTWRSASREPPHGAGTAGHRPGPCGFPVPCLGPGPREPPHQRRGRRPRPLWKPLEAALAPLCTHDGAPPPPPAGNSPSGIRVEGCAPASTMAAVVKTAMRTGPTRRSAATLGAGTCSGDRAVTVSSGVDRSGWGRQGQRGRVFVRMVGAVNLKEEPGRFKAEGDSERRDPHAYKRRPVKGAPLSPVSSQRAR